MKAKGTLCARWVGMQAEAGWSGFPTDLGWSSFSRDLGVETRQLRTEWEVRQHWLRMGQL